MSGQQPLERQWTILQTISSRRFGATIRELSEEYGVSQKTIRRDLELLQGVGFPIEPRTGANGRNHWATTADAAVPAVSFDISELLSLHLARTLLQPFAGTLVWDAAQTALKKVRATLGERALKYFEDLGSYILRTSFRDSDYHDQSQLIDDLIVATEDRCFTHITYQSARSTEPLTYPVHPYGLVYHRGSLYLVAQSEQHDEIRTFKVDRISAVAKETLKFSKPADFDLKEYLKDSLGIFHGTGEPQRVVIRFDKEVTRYIQEHRWHPSQTLTPQPDGSIRVELQLSDLHEVKAWVLSFGAKARVEEPEELRDAIVSELHDATLQYERQSNA